MRISGSNTLNNDMTNNASPLKTDMAIISAMLTTATRVTETPVM